MTKQEMCVHNSWRYIEFFTGTAIQSISPAQKGDSFKMFFSFNDQEKSSIIEQAKTRLAQDYHVIGVLEQFEDTLELFEYMLPKFYKGAMEVWRSAAIQTTRNQTRSLNKHGLSPNAEAIMKQQVLKYEYDLYDFTRSLFNERLRRKRGGMFSRMMANVW